MKVKLNFYHLSFAFVILSALRMTLLPEIQLLIFIGFVFYERKVNYRVLLLIITIFCTHFYVIPDAIFRENSSNYPSFYTKSYYSIKILDVFTLLLLTFLIPEIIKNIHKIVYIRYLPTFLFFTSLFGLLFLNINTFAIDQFLFILRSYLLLACIFIISVNLTHDQLVNASKLAIFSWILKMASAIVFVHPNPLYREIFGFNGIIYFAGDEYLNIPLYLCIIMVIRGLNTNFFKMYVVTFIVLILIILAQRKGGFPILMVFLLTIYSFQRNIYLLGLGIKFYIFTYSILIFLFLLYLKILVDEPLILLAFNDYNTLTITSLKSYQNLLNGNSFSGLLGISPFGKYEIIGLPVWADHFMSFGKEVGEKYRYQFWSFPFGRALLNSGIFGVIIILIYYIKSFKFPLPLFYVITSAFAITYYENLTPVSSICFGILFALLYKLSSKEKNSTDIAIKD